MQHVYENLGPERFQQFCQSLLLHQYPDLTCLPLRQRDGGRDALLRADTQDGKELVVFQVKYVEKPLTVRNPHTWLTATLRKELPSIRELIDRDATRYVLLTNVPGTAAPDAGSIDQVNNILQDQIKIPSQCLWRDDLDRRVENAPLEFKWQYIDLFLGADVLKLLIQGGTSDEAHLRRLSALRAYVASQFEADSEARFKQVQAKYKLLDVFVDVPMEPRQSDWSSSAGRDYAQLFWQLQREAEGNGSARPELHPRHALRSYGETQAIGAAYALLHPALQETMPFIVLEGAPGQGKSTLAQYISQVHRARLLEDEKALRAVPAAYRRSQGRLPLKVELRDLAAWLARRNPFSPKDPTALPNTWHNSLESFLAAQVVQESGGTEFDVSDLKAVLRSSAVLLVLDGLDEVADLEERREVVEEIDRAVVRLRSEAAALQVLVTTRPAAFPGAPALPQSKFLRWELAALTPDLITDYAERWLKANAIKAKEKGEVHDVLRTKLSEPHLRDLARNPMQLAILLSLIHSRGPALPEERTALYDSYIDLFLNRESEKSEIVRKQRKLLIDLHQFLAWYLHTGAELGRTEGRISAEDLQSTLSSYLQREGRDPSLITTLFRGMVERVVAIVHRVEGTYEFEVQPLREYFAGKYLYETAPYSPVGAAKPGTLPDRFDAIARNPYWLNVSRFFAGCYNKGELPSLVHGLEELADDPTICLTHHPRVLATLLLSDLVFSQSTKCASEVTDIVMNGLGQRHALSRSSMDGRERATVLPPDSGGKRIADGAFELLCQGVVAQDLPAITAVWERNTDPERRKMAWLHEADARTGEALTNWFAVGANAGVLAALEQTEIERLLSDEPDQSERLYLLLKSGHTDAVEQSESRVVSVIDAFLDGGLSERFLDFPVSTTPLMRFVRSMAMLVALPPIRRWSFIREDFANSLDDDVPTSETQPLATQLTKVQRAIDETIGSEDAFTSSTSWEKVLELVRSEWGDRWMLHMLATSAAGLPATESNEKPTSLLDTSVPLLRRHHEGRRHAGAPRWWRNQIDQCLDAADIMSVLLSLLSWTGPVTLTKLIPEVDDAVRTLSSSQFSAVVDRATFMAWAWKVHREDFATAPSGLPGNLSPRTVAAIGVRATREMKRALYEKYLATYNGAESRVWRLCQQVVYPLADTSLDAESLVLAMMKEVHARGIHVEVESLMDRHRGSTRLTPRAARSIMSEPEQFPLAVTSRAEAVLTNAHAAVPVGTIAAEQGWFGTQPSA